MYIPLFLPSLVWPRVEAALSLWLSAVSCSPATDGDPVASAPSLALKRIYHGDLPPSPPPLPLLTKLCPFLLPHQFELQQDLLLFLCLLVEADVGPSLDCVVMCGLKCVGGFVASIHNFGDVVTNPLCSACQLGVCVHRVEAVRLLYKLIIAA